MKILHLTLTRRWFDLIASGEKLEEYREIKPYWINRLAYTFIHQHDESGERFTFEPYKFDVIRFKNGYAKDAPAMDVECESIDINIGLEEWGAVKDKKYFVISLGKVLSISNYKTETA